MASDEGLEYPILVDPESATIRDFGILNEDHGKIPHPTAVIIDRDGIVRFVRVDEDYTVRPAPEELFRVLEELAADETE